MRALVELLRIMHLGQQSLSVAVCEREVLRAKEHLALALDAQDRARAADRIAQTVPPRRIPSFLLINKEQT